jgi:5-methylcytosine-specific restriction endonuclease McrA
MTPSTLSDEDRKRQLARRGRGNRKKFPKKVRDQVFAKTDGQCYYCGGVLIDAWHIDHKNGDSTDHDPENLVAACAECNCREGQASAEEFKRKVQDRERRNIEWLYDRLDDHERKSRRYGLDLSEQFRCCRRDIGDLVDALLASELIFFGEREGCSN